MLMVGVGGQAQNGKDCLSDYLRVELNNRMAEDFWQRAAFAKNVKRIFCETFNKDMYFVEKWKVVNEAPPDLDMPVRKALQFIGDGFRLIKSTIWMDMLFRESDTPRIVSDARYINELRAIKMHGGFIVVIARPDKINDDPNGSEAEIRPVAEWAIRNKDKELLPVKDWVNFTDPLTPAAAEFVDRIVVNDGTVEDLYHKIKEYLVPAIEQYFKIGENTNALH